LDSATGLIGLFLLMVLQVIIPPIPAELIAIFSGKYCGVAISTLVGGSGLYLGSVLVYLAGTWIHRKFDYFFSKYKIRCVLEAFNRYHKWILWIRLLPYNPSDIIAYAAGILKINRSAFLTITFFTSYIRCFLLSWMGAKIEGWESASVALSILIISAFLVYVVLFTKNKHDTDNLKQ
tara:strand:- start:3422 stop:3955 length:534 start_codon:yes stop_codon:yes gene_type:complete